MMPTDRARAIGFDPALRSGEDIPFYISFFLENDDLSIKVCPIEAHAVYYRSVRPGTLSRPKLSYQFNVTERLEVVERIERLHPRKHWQRRAAKHMVRGQCRFINEYLLAYPEQHGRVLDDIHQRDLQSILYRRLNQGLGHTLVLAGVAPPSVHPEAVRVATQIRDAGAVVDVICAGPTPYVAQDKTLRAIWRPYVESILRVEPANVDPETWAWVNRYWQQGCEFIAKQLHKDDYRVLHSTADNPAGVLFAAYYKVAHPDTRWIAEYPASVDRPESAASGHGPDPALLAVLTRGLRKAGVALPEDGAPRAWAQQLCLALADETRAAAPRTAHR
jgi:hypothetical protein